MGAITAMTMELYASFDEEAPRFDGHRAWRHLHDNLGMTLRPVTSTPELSISFDKWLIGIGDAVQVDNRGAQVLSPPEWLD